MQKSSQKTFLGSNPKNAASDPLLGAEVASLWTLKAEFPKKFSQFGFETTVTSTRRCHQTREHHSVRDPKLSNYPSRTFQDIPEVLELNFEVSSANKSSHHYHK
ncbi:hypothetical protein BTVI_121066 [Pitangus sulphuratus]|nr:hypothetical protein BTVI_121066 [Pitangus sulphuratus]